MDINRLPQLCQHLIADFISDEIATQKKLVETEYKATRVKEMYKEIVQFVDNSVYVNKTNKLACKIKKDDLATLFQAYKGAEETACVYLKTTPMGFVSELSRHYRNVIDNSNLGTLMNIMDRLFARTYREYSVYQKIKPKPKSIKLKNKKGELFDALLIE